MTIQTRPAGRGRFITFEGGEGSGKSTQARLLAARLDKAGFTTLVTREPGGSPGAEAIRHVILSGAAKPLGANAEAVLFAAARSDHVATAIEPSLAGGTWVISDRFADSTRVYQGVLGNVDARLIRALERVTIGQTRPDLTIVLDVPAELGLARARARAVGAMPDRFESEDIAFHQQLRAAYRDLGEAEPERCAIVDASRAADEVASAVWQLVTTRLVVPASLAEAREALE